MKAWPADTIAAVVANGGEIVQTIGADAPEITARFRILSGNVMPFIGTRVTEHAEHSLALTS